MRLQAEPTAAALGSVTDLLSYATQRTWDFLKDPTDRQTADELRALVEQRRERWLDRGYTGAQLLDIIHTLDAMPTPTCETCVKWLPDCCCVTVYPQEIDYPHTPPDFSCNRWQARP